jgi:hypothetical protein
MDATKFKTPINVHARSYGIPPSFERMLQWQSEKQKINSTNILSKFEEEEIVNLVFKMQEINHAQVVFSN